MRGYILDNWPMIALLGVFLFLCFGIPIMISVRSANTQGKAEQMCTNHCDFLDSSFDWVKPHSSCKTDPNAWDCQYVCMCTNGEYLMFNLSDRLTESEEDDTVEE